MQRIPSYLLSLLVTRTTLAFYASKSHTTIHNRIQRVRIQTINAIIDRQSDEKYGRGITHISADISEGEIIAYQDGTWFVDGNAVGDGSDATIRYLLVDTIQIVWTHNCEHGVINGFDVTVNNSQNEPSSVDGSGAIVEVGSIFDIGNEYVQCGPEQVLAKIPVLRDDGSDALASLVRFVPLEEMVTE